MSAPFIENLNLSALNARRVMPSVRRRRLLNLIKDMHKRSVEAGIILFAIVRLYCFLRVIQAAWLSATPNSAR